MKVTRKEKRKIFYISMLLLSVLITIFLDKSIGCGIAPGATFGFFNRYEK